jgi:hypothetical protein
MQLGPTDIEGIHLRRTMLQRAVSEATSGCTDVQHHFVSYLDLELQERMVELVATPRHEPSWFIDEQGVSRRDETRRILDHRSLRKDNATIDQLPRVRCVFRQTKCNQAGHDGHPGLFCHCVDRKICSTA